MIIDTLFNHDVSLKTKEINYYCVYVLLNTFLFFKYVCSFQGKTSFWTYTIYTLTNNILCDYKAYSVNQGGSKEVFPFSE